MTNGVDFGFFAASTDTSSLQALITNGIDFGFCNTSELQTTAVVVTAKEEAGGNQQSTSGSRVDSARQHYSQAITAVTADVEATTTDDFSVIMAEVLAGQ